MPEFQYAGLGTLIHLGVIVSVIVASFWKLRLEVSKEVDKIRQEFSGRLAVLESRVTDLWEWWKKENGA
jgi:hypothetical protein